MSLRKNISIAVIIAGGSAMAAQIVFMRELLVLFCGNEISIGIILASWLIWGAIGSAVLGRLSDRIAAAKRLLAYCHLILAAILPFSLFMIRSFRALLGISTGEILGYGSMMAIAVSVLFLPCLLLGFMFSLACRVYSFEEKDPGKSIARVYVFEALGALAAGIVVSLFLFKNAIPYNIIFFLSVMNICASYLIVNCIQEANRFMKWAVLLFLVVVCALGGFGAETFRQESLGRLWKGFDVLGSRDSVYGNITVTARGGQVSFFDSGLHLYSVPDVMGAEEAAHLTLLQVLSPEKVLVIGGGMGGVVSEILKHPVKKVDYVELDPEVIDMGEEYLPDEETSFLSDERVNVVYGDGRFYVKNAKEAYDAVIIGLGDPYTAQLNRFYTVGFFGELARILDGRGVVSFALTSSANYIGGELREYLRSIYLSASEVFPNSLLIPGDNMRFLFGGKDVTFVRDPVILDERLDERGIKTSFAKSYLVPDRMDPDRMAYAEKMVAEGSDVGKNFDFRPISYYYATVFWGTQFASGFFQRAISVITFPAIWGGLILLCSILATIVFKKKNGGFRRVALITVMTTGSAEIVFQLLVILAFQIIYGFVYYKLGLIISSFMVGLALGGWFVSRRLDVMQRSRKALVLTQILIVVYPLILPVVFYFFYARAGDSMASWVGSNIVFPVLPVIAGLIGGIQFPLANRVCLEGDSRTGRVAGVTYGLDLGGACIGSIIAATLLVPVLGVIGTCVFAAVINGFVLLLFLFRR